ncbi:MAG: AAA family ATPase [Candidatus Aenigmarchaeota archaeon]|nr:AAA family ATPase [Candidatus Aenigmarchaeota archaeon]
MNMNNGCQMFINYIKAGYPLLYVQTYEEERAILSFTNIAQEAGYACFSWDIVAGLRDLVTGQARQMPDPLKPLQAIVSLPEGVILFLKDFHRFINAVEILRTLKNLVPVLKATDRHIVLVSPVLQIPVELEKDITVLDFELPTVAELLELANKIVQDNALDISVDERAIAAAKGLTLAEAENAMALSVILEKTFSKKILEQEKLQAIRKSGLMELYEPVPESELGGLENLKKYIRNRKKGFENPALPKPKGILLVGLPGAGKSLSAKVIASVLDFPLIRLDIASLKGSLVGESEAKMRQALALIDAVSPCVVWLDEIEKALGGVQSSNRTDGGTTAAMFGILLTWMQESKTPKYIVATCNDIDDLLSISQGALLRRFDDIFFIDLPSEEERKSILAIMNRKYNTNLDLSLASRMEGWTGAEIEKFVIASIYDGVEEAFANIKPIFYQNREKIEKAREWARHNARLANGSGQATQSGRKLKIN